MGMTIYQLIIGFLFWIPLTILFLRLALPLVRAPFSDPVVGWVYGVTNPVFRPIERFVPRYRNLSLTALLLFWLTATLEYMLLFWFTGSPLAWMVGGLAGALGFAIGAMIVCVVLSALFSLFQPRAGTSIVYLVERLAQPMLRAVRRFVPPIGPIDLSPAIVVLGLLIVRLLLTGLLYELASRV